MIWLFFSGTTTTVAGSSSGYVDGVGTNAWFYVGLQELVADASGNLYIADGFNSMIRKMVISSGKND